MYNKHFTMKRSELKEAIKAEIKSVLSEEITEAKFIKFKGDSDDNKMEVEAEREMNTPDGELKVYTVKTDDGVQSYTADQVEVVNEIAPMGPGQTTTLADLEDEDLITVSKKEFENQFDQLEGGFIEIEDFLTAVKEIVFGKIAPRGMMREEKETLDSVLKKIKDELEIYKTSKDTDKKKAAVEKLKDLNKKKKDLLSKEEEKVANIGRNQELDA